MPCIIHLSGQRATACWTAFTVVRIIIWIMLAIIWVEFGVVCANKCFHRVRAVCLYIAHTIISWWVCAWVALHVMISLRVILATLRNAHACQQLLKSNISSCVVCACICYKCVPSASEARGSPRTFDRVASVAAWGQMRGDATFLVRLYPFRSHMHAHLGHVFVYAHSVRCVPDVSHKMNASQFI